jgi:hypothetical protein
MNGLRTYILIRLRCLEYKVDIDKHTMRQSNKSLLFALPSDEIMVEGIIRGVPAQPIRIGSMINLLETGRATSGV